ncbi:MAG: hypothetical protein QOJ65_835 [Fimbriimonadaceae bacterium]|jgi:hypothetical protein|nr:hypothetical protein [Fimbriimonadaceae bacterium]
MIAYLSACLLLTPAQGPSGTYMGTPWQINAHHTLVWGGQPYMPVGVQIDGTTAEVDRAIGAGAKDLLVDLPANGSGWSDAFADLNKNQSRFLLRINSLAPMAKGIAVEPQGFRVANITTAKHVAFEIPDATNALVLLVNQTDSTIVKKERVPIRSGQFSYDVPNINGMGHVLLVYPEMTSLEQPDFWDGLDSHRDALLSSLKRSSPGAGLRGIVNPLGRMLRIPGKDSRFVPTSTFFRDELRTLLEDRYRSLETATRAWTVRAPDFADFDAIARLVPLWSGYRGVPSLWDPSTDRLYDVDNKRSTAWKDINDAVLLAATRRFKSLVSAIRQVTDVPVVQEWSGWAPPYDGSHIAIDGVAVRASGSTPSALIDSSSRAVSSLLRWTRPGWLLATDVDLGEKKGNLTSDEAIDQLADMGVRGWFTKDLVSKTVDSALAESSPSVLYFPENATNPPMAQKLPGGKWWLPSPANGDRLDLGSRFAAYRLDDGPLSFTALWSPSGTQRTTLRFADPKRPTFETLDGSDPQPKLLKNGVEVTLTDSPLIIRNSVDIPVPDSAAEETIAQFTSLLKALGVERGAVSEEQYYFAEAAKGFERFPGPSLVAMRSVLAKSILKVAPYSWIEAESSKDHNFSQIHDEPGCSRRTVLELDTKIMPEGGFYASYELPVRSQADQEVWIAARIPPAHRDQVTVFLASQSFRIPDDAVSSYADGYAWYRLGTTKLGGRTTNLKIVVNSPGGADLGIDAVLIYPGSFKPNGVQMPLLAIPTAGKG